MPKIKIHEIGDAERRKIVLELLDVVSSLHTKREMFEFLFRLLTPSEVLMLARRLQIAKLILDGRGYEEISKKLHVSHRTIADIDGWLRENNTRAQLVMKKIQAAEASGKKGKKSEFSENMLDKYAHHRFMKQLFS